MSPRRRVRLAPSDDATHHLTGPFLPQTPLSSPRALSPVSPTAKAWAARPVSPYLRWAIQPASAAKLLLVPVVLYANWHLTGPFLAPGWANPFAPFFLISGRVPSSAPDDPRYQKSYLDLVFIAYNVVFFSFVRQIIVLKICNPIARYFGLRKSGKIERFGEQGYALAYFGFFGAWGYVTLFLFLSWPFLTPSSASCPSSRHTGTRPNYPHWDMNPELKRYYLMQMAYWLQQLLVLVLGLEKPRKDYAELVAHHIVTLWLVGWSYLMNLTLIGNAVYMSMDIPDAFLAFSKILNYIQWNRAKVFAFVVFLVVWSYFRHWLNFRILWSVWDEIPLMPESSKTWDAARGVYFPWWMTYQVFTPLLLLQFLNLFWYMLMLRILKRALFTDNASDIRSDDEDEGEDDNDAKKAEKK
ncbi:hypothetical protein C0993_000030 [Termitomyces sp. T159_Od127]|nr:hypothetical protein C0993_000030 [Termitomyces sp. T159_Od127]